MNHIAPVLTPERVAAMSLEAAVQAAAAQVEAQNPGLSDDKLMELTFELVDGLLSVKQREELAITGLMAELDEHHDDVAANLLAPQVVDGNLLGVLVFVGDDGAEMAVSLHHATVEQLERPFYMHHRAAYLECARLLRRHGFSTYRAGYEAGIFTTGKDAS